MVWRWKHISSSTLPAAKVELIAWLAHQLIGLHKDGAEVFDSIIVITDRRILDSRFERPSSTSPVSSIIGAVREGTDSQRRSSSRTISAGKKIIISTVQTFPFVLDQIGEEHRGKKFASSLMRRTPARRTNGCRNEHGAFRSRRGEGRRDNRGQNQPHH